MYQNVSGNILLFTLHDGLRCLDLFIRQGVKNKKSLLVRDVIVKKAPFSRLDQ